jgi:hypothetical protein
VSGVARDIIIDEFQKEFRFLFTAEVAAVENSTLLVLQWLVASEASVPLFLRPETLPWIVQQAMKPHHNHISLEILNKISSHSRCREHLCRSLAHYVDLFGVLVTQLSGFAVDHVQGKEISSYECGLVLDLISCIIHGASLSPDPVKPIQSYNPLIELLEIFFGFSKIGSQIAHLLEMIARLQAQGVSIHFRTDDMLHRLYSMVLKRQDGAKVLSLVRKAEPCFNIITAFIAILQYHVSPASLEPEAVERKYFDYFIQLSKIEELHWVIQKPWTGGTVILQKLFTTHWHHFSHMLPLIPKENIELNDKLGAGSFGTVYAGIWRQSHRHKEVAIKVVNNILTRWSFAENFCFSTSLSIQI